jgi:hypothetical protein
MPRVFDRAKKLLGEQQVVDLTGVAGTYVGVAMLLAMAEQGMPADYAGARAARRARKPSPAKPRSIIAQVDGSGVESTSKRRSKSGRCSMMALTRSCSRIVARSRHAARMC